MTQVEFDALKAGDTVYVVGCPSRAKDVQALISKHTIIGTKVEHDGLATLRYIDTGDLLAERIGCFTSLAQAKLEAMVRIAEDTYHLLRLRDQVEAMTETEPGAQP